MKKIFVIALLTFALGTTGRSQTAEGFINGPHITIQDYNNWGEFCNNIVLVQQKSDPVTKYYLYATNYNASSLYIPSIDKLFNNGEEVTVTNLNINIKNDGKVGVGTDNPETALDVRGTIKAFEIKVEAQTADFVFEPDYKLRPLNEVEAFVKTNKHLPEIPSAKQMKADGVNVAEMNKLLLQKVEELTLYLIEAKKDNTIMKIEINKLKNQIRK